jgi:LysM repeat protein
MKGCRQAALSLAMAFLMGGLVLGSISLSLFEGGYTLVQPYNPDTSSIVFSGQQVVNLAGATLTAASGGALVLLTPTQASCAYPAGWLPVTIQSGQTLPGLALAYGVSAAALKTGNCMLTDSLLPGAFLYVPPNATQAPRVLAPTPTVCRTPYGWVTYTVRPGDTLAGLGAAVGMTAWSLQTANCLPSAYIYSGQSLYLPYYPQIYPTATWGPTATYMVFATRTPTLVYTTPAPTNTWPPTLTASPTPWVTPTVETPTETVPLPPTATETPVPPPTATEPPPPTATPLPPPTNTLPPPPTEPLPPTPTSGNYTYP